MSLFTSKEQQEEIIHRFLEGLSLRQIEAEYSIARKRLSQWFKENNISRKPLLSKSQLKDAFLRIENGESLVSVSQELSVPRQTLYSLFIKAGLITPVISIPPTFKLSEEHSNFMSGESLESISKRYGVSASHVRSIFQDKGFPTSRVVRKYSLDETYFSTIDSSEKAYWLGFIYADGSVSSGVSHVLEITLKSSDSEHLENLKEAIQSNAPLSQRDVTLQSTGKTYQASRLNICSKELVEDLIRHGVHPNKSLTKSFPSIPSLFLDSFFLGYFDGNGSVSLPNGYFRISIHSGSPDFLNSLKDVSRSIGFMTSDVKKGSSNHSYFFNLNGFSNASRLKEIMTTHPYSLSRKRDLLSRA